MKLYQGLLSGVLWAFLCIAGLVAAAGCAAPQAAVSAIEVIVTAEEQEVPVSLPAGSTVEDALQAAGLELGPLDRAEPPLFTVLASGDRVRLVRVSETFEVVQQVIPFQSETLQNESLPLDQEVYLQKGHNGLQEITYRRVYEDGMEISSSPIKSTTVEPAVSEIVMVGIQTPFTPVAIPGRLVYLRDGNVWTIEENTANRRAVVTTGDLDGRIFTLSEDGAWLLFTRKSEEPDEINRLWAVDVGAEEPRLVDLDVPNVIHFADFIPGNDFKIVFSTVEPRSTAPGWQANNDLQALTFATSGWTTQWNAVLEANTGGVYGWWGTNFAWSPDDNTLAVARPDGIQLLDFAEGTSSPLIDVIPYQTGSDWAWIPGISWGPDGRSLFLVDHVPPPGAVAPEEAQSFDLSVIPIETGKALNLVSQSGMFAYPLTSPAQPQPTGELAYEVAFLQAVFPDQSETSRYRLGVMDRDSSNRRLLFPPEGLPGIKPQADWGAWAPEKLPSSNNYAITVIYEGNLWLIDTATGEARQFTGDGLTTRLAWKPMNKP